ncbi:MAG: chloride channel protein [Alphaproteobacteria bacterium]|nr:chloride channel protein [Alphaproteobacteria bacterium]MDE1985788.1 chloride channel protein [Alphaproteobacteria bacterium]MDE2163804.1 chloride channel protein [Alphaproteobacteria bacterium]MDE2264328.1 chloride channel protein [Alphaproteobacteria bacterium]MDE2499247.1 chloride channel protein [Alphaproteobacteria bacterium]
MAAQIENDRPIGLRARGALLVRRSRLALAAIQRDLRASEVGQILLCALLGVAIGVSVDVLREGVVFLHRQSFALPMREYLSTGIGVSDIRIMIVPALGGLLLALFRHVTRRFRKADIVDPIEANALYGGRMSFRDSMRLTITTLISNGAGASLGMEAGYSQFGAAVYSFVGQYFRLRRSDLRVFTTAGAAAAIAAAFNAPLAGAFYGFELILGSYLPRALAPVVVASVCAALMQRSMTHMRALFEVPSGMVMEPRSYFLFGLMGVVAAGIAIATMRAVTWTEQTLRATGVPDWLRPAVGGFLLSCIALYFPQVLGSGHGAIQFHFDHNWPWLLLLALLAAKLIASAVSIGSGFRGGLFSSSLFLGALFGGTFVEIAAMLMPDIAAQRAAFMLAGMGSVAAAIIGAPLTMVFLTLESTGDFPVTLGVLVAVTIASTIVRLTFGYSFATWRFQLKGLGIRGAHDVGWISDLTVGRLMRSDPKTATNDVTLRALREMYPPGSAKRLFVVDRQGFYVGSIDAIDMHNPMYDDALQGLVAGDLAGHADLFLAPGENVRTALLRFEDTQSEALPVLASRSDRRLIGYMTEAYSLKRYTQELEQLRSVETGGSDLFPLGKTSHM